MWSGYVNDRAADGVGKDRFKDNWTRLQPHFGHRLGTAITKQDCRDYAAALKGYSPSTIKTDLSLLRACLRWRYGPNGAPAIWVGHNAPPRDNWLTKDQARQLLDATDTPHVKLFIVLGLSTGARGGAILDLTWDRVDFDQGMIDYKPAGRIQTNKRRNIVPMNNRARAALEEAHRGRLTDHVVEFGGKPVASVKKALQRLSAKTGIVFSAHTLRHTCAVWMAQADTPMHKISEYLGHTNINTTAQHYARYSPSFMRDASAAVEF